MVSFGDGGGGRDRTFDRLDVILLVLAVGIALVFEVVNGFHDTANAVATVIYTKSLGRRYAVVWSGMLNFLGVLIGGTAVAFSIVHLLPVDLLVHIDTGAGMAMVLALLAGGDHLELRHLVHGDPGLQLAHPDRGHHRRRPGEFVAAGPLRLRGQLAKAVEVGLSLLHLAAHRLLSGGGLSAAVQETGEKPRVLHSAAAGRQAAAVVGARSADLTCTGVSFAHGSNDGQKGIGLIMLILIGLVPGHFAIDADLSEEKFHRIVGPSPD